MKLTTPPLFAGGELGGYESQDTIPVVSPITEQEIGRIVDADPSDVDGAVRAARAAFVGSGWPQLSFAERAGYLRALADFYEGNGDELSRMVTTQNGIPLEWTLRQNSTAPASIYRNFASLADRYVVEEVRPSFNGTTTVIRQEPLGVVGFILPWNAPHLLLAFKLAPALLAGNTVVFKAAPETSLDLAVFAEAINAAGFPPGVVNFFTGGRLAGDALVRHPQVAKIAFTGSTAAGRNVAEACGRSLKPVTLELGGKSAAILLEDVDIDRFVADIPRTCLSLAGQSCHANSRILAPRGRYEEIVAKVAEAMAGFTVGDPFEPGTVWGPLVAERQRDRVEAYIRSGVDEGAKLVTGGGRPRHLPRGFYIEPTVFRDVDNRMTIAREEIFGPVLGVIPYDDVDDAIAISNDSAFGLGGVVYTEDHDRGVEVARRIESGSIGVNRYGVDYNAPYGGYKDSGLGRELGYEAVNTFRQSKAIYV